METTEVVTEVVTEVKKKRGAQKGRVMSEAQKAGLQAGRDKLKELIQNRVVKDKIKEEKKINQQKQINQEQPVVNQSPAESVLVNPLVNPTPIATVEPVAAPVVTPVVTKKPRERQPKVNYEDFSRFKDDVIQNISHLKKPEQIQPVIVEKHVYLTGYELLNKIFNFN